MMDDDVGTALRQLPRAKTSPRFTSDVMRAVRGDVGRASARLPMLRFAMSFAMMLVIVVGLYAGHVQKQHARMDALRAEHRKIESELKQVKAITDEAKPVVVLENGDTRVIVDLNQSQQTYY